MPECRVIPALLEPKETRVLKVILGPVYRAILEPLVLSGRLVLLVTRALKVTLALACRVTLVLLALKVIPALKATLGLAFKAIQERLAIPE